MSTSSTKSTVIRINWPWQERIEEILENELKRSGRSDNTEIEVDCKQMIGVSSLDIRRLWEAKLCCDDRQLPMKLVSVSSKLCRVMESLDLDELFAMGKGASESRTQKNSETSVDHESTSLEFDIFPTQESIQDASSIVRSFMSKNGIPNLVEFEITTALYEVYTNIRLHSTLGPDAKISVCVSCENRLVKISVRDNGIAFDPSLGGKQFSIAETIASKKTNGLGLYMINRLSDRIRYSRVDNNCNLLTIEKEW